MPRAATATTSRRYVRDMFAEDALRVEFGDVMLGGASMAPLTGVELASSSSIQKGIVRQRRRSDVWVGKVLREANTAASDASLRGDNHFVVKMREVQLPQGWARDCSLWSTTKEACRTR
jgi:hypothetical protein